MNAKIFFKIFKSTKMRQLEMKFLLYQINLSQVFCRGFNRLTYFKGSAIDIPINYSYLMMNNEFVSAILAEK